MTIMVVTIMIAPQTTPITVDSGIAVSIPTIIGVETTMTASMMFLRDGDDDGDPSGEFPTANGRVP